MSTDKKDIRDYLHFYLGCKFMYMNGPKIWDGWSGFSKTDTYYYSNDERDHIVMGSHGFQVNEIKLILRPLSSMTEEEHDHVAKLLGYQGYSDQGEWGYDPEWFKEFFGENDHKMFFNPPVWIPVMNYLRTKSIDIDGLIESGLAIQQPKVI